MIDWKSCLDKVRPSTLTGKLYRLIESQTQVATVPLVSSLEKQAILESLLEATKPTNHPDTPAGMHYLFSTPFRYPPLKYGSRFGSRQEPSLFYGSGEVGTVLAESAYYRFLFWQGMATPPKDNIRTSHSLLQAGYQTDRGLKLQVPPFVQHEATLTHRSAYLETQALGSQMRATGVELFQYVSARDVKHGINIALFTPRAFVGKKPLSIDPWECELSADRVLFYDVSGRQTHGYPITNFAVDGVVPIPA